MTQSKCAACSRKALVDRKYCVHHSQAYDGLMTHYRTWVEAYGQISMKDFMGRLLKMKETGSWAKEVIEIEAKQSTLE